MSREDKTSTPKKTKNHTPLESIQTAFFGLIDAIKSEGSVRSILVVGIIFVALSRYTNLSFMGTAFMAFVWVQVLVSEIFNSSLEKALDYASDKEYHILIKKGKDFAAGSVFILSTFAWIFSISILIRYWN